MKKVLRFLVVLLVLIALGIGGAWLWLKGNGKPQRSGEHQLAGLEAPVTVRFDARAVPHVQADNEADLAAAVGWLHANDRMTQLEMGRRLAFGRLAEVVGAPAFNNDIYFRTFGFASVAAEIEKNLDPRSRTWLEGYARGINAWIERGERPPGLILLRAQPEPWTVRDSIGFYLLMGHNLSFFQGRPEEARFRVLTNLGEERAADILPEGTILHPEIVEISKRWLPAPGPAETASLSDPEANPNDFGVRLARNLGTAIPGVSDDPGGAWGSNAWAVGNSLSKTGAPLLANDPHLPMNLPPTWFQVHLASDDLRLSGFTLPGLPFVIIGRSEHLAWGVTANMLDDHDVFVEEVSDDGTQVRRGEEWTPLVKRTETIRVGDEERGVDFRTSDIGPFLAASQNVKSPDRSLAWTLLQETSDPFIDFLHLTQAANVTAARAGLGGYVGAAQNLLVVDRDGGLLQTILGRIPQRRSGIGNMLLPAWDPAYGWDGIAPQSANPTLLAAGSSSAESDSSDAEAEDAETALEDGASGSADAEGEEGEGTSARETLFAPVGDLLASANEAPPLISSPAPGAYDLPYRAQRIRQLLSSDGPWDPDTLADAQSDVLCLFSRDLLPLLQARVPFAGATNSEDAEEAQRTLEILGDWDGRMSPTGPATLFSLAEERLIEAIFRDESRKAQVLIGSREQLLRILRGEISESWADNGNTEEVESLDQALASALASAGRDARAAWGDDVASWPYATQHTLRLDHILGAVPVIGPQLGRGPLPIAGSYTTILAFDGPLQNETLRTTVRTGPTGRWVADLGSDASRAALPGGQSGHPFDDHYDDQLEDFVAGRSHPAPWSDEAITAATESTLQLVP
ncbi:MAG: penicillin acylase family protein [Acidobacteriota bacterium]